MPCAVEKKQKFICSTCKRTIVRKARDRMSAIRRHYKAQHPRKFRTMIKKGTETRRLNR